MTKARAARSLVTTLAVAFFGASVMILLVNESLALISSILTNEDAISSKQQLIARDAAKSVSGYVQDKVSTLEMAARFGRPFNADPETRKTIIGSVLGQDPAFRQLALLDSQGRQVAQGSRILQTLSSQFSSQLNGEAFSQTSKGLRFIGRIYIDDISNEPLVVIAVPAMNVFGDFQATLAAEVNLKYMWDLVSQLQVGTTGYAYVVDNTGTLIAFKNTSRVLRGENVKKIQEVSAFIKNLSTPSNGTPGLVNYTGLLGATVMGTYVSLGTPAWAVVTEMPWQEAYHTVFLVTALSVATLLVTAVLAGVMGVFIARRLTVPLVNLTKTATRIAGGEMGLRTAVSGPQEVVSLARAFNSMTGQMHELIGSLEQRVSDRTADLGRANEQLKVELADRKLAERERQERLAMLSALIGAMRAGILVEDGNRHVFAANDALRAMLGSLGTAEEPVGTDAVALNRALGGAASDPDSFAPRITAITEARQPISAEEIHFRGGRIFERDYLPVSTPDDRLIAHFWQYRDVTDRRRVEAQLMRAQRLEGLSTLAGGIAHQFNNINTVVQGYLQILMSTESLLPEGRGYVEKMLDGVSRSVEITARLQEFTRGIAAEDANQVTVAGLVTSVLAGFKNQVEAESVHVHLDVDENATARISPTALWFVMSSLVSNAIHALLDAQTREITIRCRTASESVVLEVRDTGCGIAPSDLAQIFTPFFTTKGEWSSRGSPQARVKGIGLSLAVSQTTVTERGGSIEVESELGVGSTFRVLLPRL